MKPLFIETQRFNQWWVWLILLLACVLPVYGFYKQIILNEPWGNNPMSNTGLIITTVIMLVFLVLFYMMQLKTKITREALSFGFIPFIKRTIPFTEIASYKVINYGFVGGWGIRLFTSYGTVYNIRGNKGLHIKLKNGKQLVIGTQKPTELEKVIKNLNNHNL